MLAIESSASTLSVALFYQEKWFVPKQDLSGQQSQAFFTLIQDVFDQIPITYQDLKLLVVTRGPGSFTGIRLGLAVAQGLSLAIGIKVFAPTTLEVLAFEAKRQKVKDYIVAIEDKRGGFFIQKSKKNPQHVTFEKLQELIKSPSVELLADHPLSTLCYPSNLAKTLIEYYLSKKHHEFSLLRPFYLYDPPYRKQS